MSATPSPLPGPEIEALAADFGRQRWHFYWSVPSQGCRPRVWAARALPCHPHAAAEPGNRLTPCGETVDADTPAGMRKLLEERP